MARKRSLKDAAADRLVEKTKTVPETPPAPAKKKAAGPGAAKAAIAEPPKESPVMQPSAVETPELPGDGKKSLPPLVWKGVPILIGCAAGYLFGVGQTTGPSNMSFLLVGLAAGYVLGRFTKIP